MMNLVLDEYDWVMVEKRARVAYCEEWKILSVDECGSCGHRGSPGGVFAGYSICDHCGEPMDLRPRPLSEEWERRFQVWYSNLVKAAAPLFGIDLPLKEPS
jgi:hypothetical protein